MKRKFFHFKILKKNKKLSRLLFYLVVILLISGAGFLFFYSFQKYEGKVNPNIRALDEDIGGFSKDQALEELRKKKDYLENRKVKIILEDQIFETSLAELGVSIDEKKILDYAFSKGRNEGVLEKYWAFAVNSVYGFKTPVFFEVDSDKLNDYIYDQLENDSDSPQSSKIVYRDGYFIALSSKDGYGVNKTLLASEILKLVNDLTLDEIDLGKKIYKKARVEEENAIQAKDKANKMLQSTITLTAGEKNWILDKETLAGLIRFSMKKNISFEEYEAGRQEKQADNLFFYTYINITGSTPDIYSSGYRYFVTIDSQKTKDYFSMIAPGIEQPAINAVLSFEDNQIKIEEESKDRISLDIDKSVSNLEKGLLNQKEVIDLAVNRKNAEISKENLSALGIESLIGLGKSNFKGSPKNRRHNIAVGASKFNGVIIKPGEVFSFLDILGPVDASTGYLPELVIKNNKTVPEYGGGMCQVSTTSFRGAVAAGFEIQERRNHAYPVQYYAPQGTDATVYIPSPDLKFKNNTLSNVLVQTKVVGNELIFEYYGTDDGRKVETLGPFIYDRKPDGSMRAKWTQQVYKADGSLWFEKTFLSKYNSPSRYPHPGEE
ncbi:MAG: hypothetical protein GF347_03525 [Candidatus Moranbacteria bacterium]|nr:hypothetical protein [Candidatus Moranbacteria bacterium]